MTSQKILHNLSTKISWALSCRTRENAQHCFSHNFRASPRRSLIQALSCLQIK